MATETVDLGKVLITHKGDWITGTDYEPLDVVNKEGSSYLCILAAVSGILLTNTTYWRPLSLSAYTYALAAGYTGSEEDFEADLAAIGNKVNSSQIKQVIGTSTTDVMSQIAVTERVLALQNPIELFSDVIDGALIDETTRNFAAELTIGALTNPTLNLLGLNNYMYNDVAESGNVEIYMWFRATDAAPKDAIADMFTTYNDKYCRIRYYIYTKSGVMPSVENADRLGIVANTSTGYVNLVGSNATDGTYTITKISDTVYRVDKTFHVSFTGTLNYILLSTVWLAAVVPVDFVTGDFGVSGLSVKFGETRDYLEYNNLIGDWFTPSSTTNIQSLIDNTFNDLQYSGVYNNMNHNLVRLSEFLRKYEMREVDNFNQLNIVMAGDSIFGRVDKSTFTPATAEMSLTPDTNDTNETDAGYVTGHFPPNMWEQNVPYKVLQMLQFPHADVKYYNHEAAEITKQGGGVWYNFGLVGADCIRLTGSEMINSYMYLTFTGATFAKFIHSAYYGSGWNLGARIKIEFSTDGGSTFVTPESLSLTSSYANNGTDGQYTLPTDYYKFGNITFGGLSAGTSYIMKVTLISGKVNVWGFETWSKPRVNVIVTAEGGNIAADQLTRWYRFYSAMYNPALIIYNLPFLNDLGTGIITKFRGLATLATTHPEDAATGDFFYATVTGVYTNLSNLSLVAGDYFEWNGGAWVLGSTQLTDKLNDFYEDNRDGLKRLASLGCPVLTLVTHNSVGWKDSHPYTFNEGLTILRNLVSQYGLASIDVNYYQMNNGYATGMFSDGTHLNDVGVELYRLLLSKVLNVPYASRYVGTSAAVKYRTLSGSGNGAATISFGYEFAEIPKVRTYNNSTIVVTTITQSSFTVTGSGVFEWEAFVS